MEVFGIGTTHLTYLLNAPDSLLLFRKVLCGMVEKLEGRPFEDPPEALAEMGDDALGVARAHHRLHWECLERQQRQLDEIRPDAILLIGDDQAQCFQAGNLPPYAIYVGESVPASPFYMSQFPGDDDYVKSIWGVPVDHRYEWPCDAKLAVALRDALLEAGFDVASSNHLDNEHWQNGLGHAHTNTQLYFRNDDGRYPIVPLFVNCYGADLDVMSGFGGGAPPPEGTFPPAPRSARLYALGQRIREVLERWPGRILVCPSSTWCHTWLTRKHQRMRMDFEGNLEKLGWLERGEGWRLARYESPEIEQNGDHEMRNWMVAAGVFGDRPLHVDAQVTSWVSMGFRVFGSWR